MKKYLLVITVSVFLLLSCNKTEKNENSKTNPELPSALMYLTALSTPVDVQFIIESSTPMLTNNSRQTISGTALDINGDKVNIGNLHINNLIISPNNNNNYGQNYIFTPPLFGQQAVFKSERVASPMASGYDFTDTLYIPNALQIDPSSYNQDLSNNIISQGKEIKWVADLNNTTGGVVIVAEYVPEDIANTAFKASYPNYLRNGLVVPDNGLVVITKPLLDGLPKGAYLQVTLARINYKKGVTSGQKSYLVCANSQKYLLFKHQ